jgi:hypothetical protein
VVDGDLRARHRPLPILGLVREIVAAYYFGAQGKINAFTVAFQVPNLVARSSPTPRSRRRSSRSSASCSRRATQARVARRLDASSG